MINIYIVTAGIYDDYHIEKVFFSKEKAEEYAKEQNDKLKNGPQGEYWKARAFDIGWGEWHNVEEYEVKD